MKDKTIILSICIFLFYSCSKYEQEQERVKIGIMSYLLDDEPSIDVVPKSRSEQKSILLLDSLYGNVRILVEYNGEAKRNTHTHIPETKTSWTNVSRNTTWAPNDAIGIYMRLSNGVPDPTVDVSNAKYTTLSSTPSGTFTAQGTALYYPDNTSKLVSLWAYYPYANVAGTEPSIVQFVDTADETDYTTLSYAIFEDQTNRVPACDLMWATKVVNQSKANTSISFTFNHRLSLFTLILNSTAAFNGMQMTKAQLIGSQVTKDGTLNLDNGSRVSGTTTFAPYNTTVRTLSSNTPQYVDFIINPCSVTSGNNGTEMRLVLTINGVLYTLPIKRASTFSFAQGARHNITVNLSTVL